MVLYSAHHDLGEYKTNYERNPQRRRTPLCLTVQPTDCTAQVPRLKTITATAGMNEASSPEIPPITAARPTISTTMPTAVQATTATSPSPVLQVSCNIFFYKLSKKLTIDGITKYARLFGLGQATGLETGDAAGHLSDQKPFAEMGEDWTVGQVFRVPSVRVNGQLHRCKWQMSPVPSPTTACAISHIWWTASGTTTTRTARGDRPCGCRRDQTTSDDVFQYVESGMIAASTNNFPAILSAKSGL